MSSERGFPSGGGHGDGGSPGGAPPAGGDTHEPAPSGRPAGSKRRAGGAFASIPLQERAPRHPDLPQLGPAPLGETRAAAGVVAGEQESLPQGEPPPREHGKRPVLEPRQGRLLPKEARAADGLDRLGLRPRPKLL